MKTRRLLEGSCRSQFELVLRHYERSKHGGDANITQVDVDRSERRPAGGARDTSTFSAVLSSFFFTPPPPKVFRCGRGGQVTLFERFYQSVWEALATSIATAET